MSLTPADAQTLRDYGLDSDDLVVVELDPGDVLIWNPFTVHGSAPNLSSLQSRRSVNASYWRAGDTDAGEWVFGAAALTPDHA